MSALKPGVKLSPTTAPAIGAMLCLEIMRKYGESVITSWCEGEHRPGSLHYVGHAFDLRSRHLDRPTRLGVVAELQAVLGGTRSEFDVVDEIDHIHVEWQPKG